VFLDEQGDSINDMLFMVNAGMAVNQEKWRDLPASYHNGAGSFSFADGHSEIHKWQVKGGVYPTVQNVTKQPYGSPNPPGPWTTPTLTANADIEWLEDHMAYH
jgi:prepilin-type processing-associated H-X9-DG protein